MKNKKQLTLKRLFLLSLLLLITGNIYAQLSISIKNKNVREAIVQIEKQSNYRFFYNDELKGIDNTISIDMKNVSIRQLLNALFKDIPISYTIQANNQVILTEKNAGIKDNPVRTVSGTVIDETGEPVIGANIRVKNSTTGAVTDIDGRFSLDVSSDAILIISYIGYTSKEVPVNGRTTLDIKLEDDAQALDEVVVVGYGTQKRASVTGAVAAIQSKDITAIKTPNISNALAGKLPGLRAVQRSGAPGDDDPEIDIRGFGSALVIVDGIERDFRQIDANDIESISILKDASASVYGFKGANGVILVTTKKGQMGKPKINYTGYVGMQTPTRTLDLFDAYQYAYLFNEAQLNIGVDAPYSQEQLAQYKAGNPNTDWWGETFNNSMPQMYHNLNVSGGAEKVKYYFSLGYTDQQGLYRSKDDSYKKYNVRSNVNAEIVKGFTVDLQLSGMLNTRIKPNESIATPMNHIIMAHPNLPVYANNTSPYWQNTGSGAANPVQATSISEVGYDERTRRQFNGSITFNWEIPWVKGLSAKALLAYDYNNLYNKSWAKQFAHYTYDPAKEEYVKGFYKPMTELNVDTENAFTPNQQYSLNYKNTFGKHDLSGLILWEMRNWRKDMQNGFRQFDVSVIDELDAGNTTNMSNKGSRSLSAHMGLVGRMNYAYDNRYLMEFSFRYDGSYKFAKDNRWGFFPAVLLGWRVSEEPFFKERISFVNNLKIRGSYGVIGDESAFSAFQHIQGYRYPSGSYVLGSGGLSNGASDTGLPNPNLTWYESTTMNIGFEASVLNGLFSAEFDYFERRRDGLLADRLLTLPTSFGQTLPQENLNSDKTRGFEIVAGHRNKIGEVSYDVKANFSITRNYDRYVERAPSSNMYDNWRNNKNDRYKNMEWGKKVIGQFTSYEDIFNSPIQDNNGNKSLMPGDLKFQDLNNDGIIDGNDDQPIGHGNVPSMYYGCNISADWKGIDLNLFLQGAAGHEVFLGGNLMSPFIQQGLGNGIEVWTDRWHREDPEDPGSAWIPGYMPALRPAGYSANGTNNTFTMHKARYIRLKSIELGYSLPKQWLGKAGIENVRIYVNSLNLLTFTGREGMMKYMDPENKDSMLRYYPLMKTFNLGVNLTF